MSISKRQKICFIHPKIFPLFQMFENADNVIGGAEINFYYLSKEFAKNKKYEVKFLVGDFGQKDRVEIDNIEFIKINGLKLSAEGLFAKICWRIKLITLLLRLDSDILLSTSVGEAASYVSIISKVIKRKKVIYRTASNADFDSALHLGQPDWLVKLFRATARFSDVIVCQNNYQTFIVRKNYGLIKTVEIPNGLPVPEFTEEGKEFFLWVGRYAEVKRPELLFELADKLPDEKFVMIMPCDDATEKIYRAKAEKCINIKFIRFVQYNKIQSYFNRAKCFINTSSFEGFPNTFIQSCIAKTPILSFAVNPNKMLTDGELGFLCDDNVETAESFLKSLSPDKIRELGTNTFAYIKKTHDFDNTVKRYMEIIDSF